MWIFKWEQPASVRVSPWICMFFFLLLLYSCYSHYKNLFDDDGWRPFIAATLPLSLSFVELFPAVALHTRRVAHMHTFAPPHIRPKQHFQFFMLVHVRGTFSCLWYYYLWMVSGARLQPDVRSYTARMIFIVVSSVFHNTHGRGDRKNSEFPDIVNFAFKMFSHILVASLWAMETNRIELRFFYYYDESLDFMPASLTK